MVKFHEDLFKNSCRQCKDSASRGSGALQEKFYSHVLNCCIGCRDFSVTDGHVLQEHLRLSEIRKELANHDETRWTELVATQLVPSLFSRTDKA